MFYFFQKVDKGLYEELKNKSALELYDYIVKMDQSLLKKKMKTFNKIMNEKEWTVNYLQDLAADRALLEMAKETNAEIVYL